jgi:predicted dehydrogenase
MAEVEDPTRRAFVTDGGKAALGALTILTAPMIVPRRVLGRGKRAPSDTINIAVVGCGGMGVQNALVLAQSEHIGAVCDVDFAYSERCVQSRSGDADGRPRSDGLPLREQFFKARRYGDFRELLTREKGIDAVVVATPDHLHASVALAALDLGKHVYVQKPLTATVHEARVLRDRARANPKLVTQMGNQGHSSEDARRINEWIGAGIIGPVHDVHVVYWPQGLPLPGGAASPPAPPRFGNPWTFAHVQDVLAAAMAGGGAPPPGLDWPLYLGPIAEDVPYHPIYHPFNWRGWLAFGSGAIGDMGAHLIDHPYWALGLTYPSSIEATSTPWGATAQGRPVSYPLSTCVHYRFEARGAQPPVQLSWFDGGHYPPRPDALPDDVELTSQGGVIFVGEKGVLVHETYGANPRLYPESLRAAADATPRTLPRIEISHELNWVQAIRGGAQASSPIEYASRLTETMLLGHVALRAGQGRKILYDGELGTVTNLPMANGFLTRDYRPGWEIG